MMRSDAGAFVEGPGLLQKGADTGPLAGTRFTAKELFDVTGLPTGCGNPQLRDAAEFFDRFLGQRPGDAQLEKQAASAHYRAGRLQIKLGEYDDGFAAIRRSLDLAASALAREPGDREIAGQVVQAHFLTPEEAVGHGIVGIGEVCVRAVLERNA